MCLLFATILMSCGGNEDKKKTVSYGKTDVPAKTEAPKPVKQKITTSATKAIETSTPASKKVDLKNKGVGPISSLKLDPTINQTMATHGADVFKKMCTACHRPNKKFIGPAPTGLLERRTPEWIMNMILDPEGMVKNDPLAKELLIEFNGSPMANQNLSKEDARAVLEYFRTLK